MQTDHSFSKFIYFDTNIWSHLVKNHEQLVSPLFNYLTKFDLTLALSGAELVELFEADRLHDLLSKVMLVLPCALIKTADEILSEEIEAYPYMRKKSIVSTPINQLLLEEGGVEIVYGWLKNEKIEQLRKDQLIYSSQMPQRIDEGKKIILQKGSMASIPGRKHTCFHG